MTDAQDMPKEIWVDECSIFESKPDDYEECARYILPGITQEAALEALEFLEQYEAFYVKHPHQIPYVTAIRTLLENAAGAQSYENNPHVEKWAKGMMAGEEEK